VAEKRRLALMIRKRGATYEQIARELGLSTKMVAWRYVHEAIAEIPAEEARDTKRLELEKLDARELRLNNLLLSIDQRRKLYEDKVKLGVAEPEDHVGLFVVEQCRIEQQLTRIAERRARLDGLDAPTRAELTGKDGAPLISLTREDIKGMTDEQLKRVVNGTHRGGGAGAGGAGAPGAAPGEDRRPH
jgi:predicted transcriptional regulator